MERVQSAFVRIFKTSMNKLLSFAILPLDLRESAGNFTPFPELPFHTNIYSGRHAMMALESAPICSGM